MALHVESILRARRFEAILDQFTGDLEGQLEERKALLQATQGITEEEAYSQLRLSISRSRRRISEVAHQFVNEIFNSQST